MKNLIVNNYLIQTPIQNIIEQLQREIHNGKLKDVYVKGDNLVVTCPFHSDGKEDKPACSVYVGEDDELEQGFFNCFVCDEKGPFSKFVSGCLDTTEAYARHWLIERFGELLESRINEWGEWKDKTKKKQAIDEIVLKSFEPHHPYMETRKLTREVCERFEVKYDPKTNCIVFPVRDPQGKLSFLTRRSVVDKTFIIDKDVEKGIYLLNTIYKENIKTVVVVESQINALTLWGWGIPAVATFGAKISDHQIELLNKSPIRHYILALDSDKAGWSGTSTLIRELRDDVYIDVVKLPIGKDVNDLTEEEYRALEPVDGQDWLTKKR